MVGSEGRAAIERASFRKTLDVGQAAQAQCPVDQLDRAHRETGMARPEPLGEPANHLVVRPALGIGRQHRAADLEIGMSARGINVVMLEKGRRRQDDVGHCRGLGHELLVYADKEVGALETAAHETGYRCYDHRVGVLDEERGDRRSVPDVARGTGQHRADPRLVEDPGGGIEQIETLDQAAIDRDETMVRIERAAALMGPGAGHRRQTGDRKELRSAIA